MSIKALKKSSASNFARLTQEIDKISSPEKSKAGADERLWKPQLDKSGNGYAVIRFLPAPNGEDLPFAKIWSHAFQGAGGWYIENSLTTLNKKDPVGELNRQLWNSGSEANKDIARKQKRKLSYYSNILVVKDSVNPDNEGKVFLYKFGKKIFDKIIEAMQPQFDDETPVNVFDPWEGADFKLKIVLKDGFWNYDKSEFAAPTPLAGGDDDAIEVLWKQEHSLTAFTDPSNFKTFEELSERLNMVLNTKPAPVRRDLETEELETEETNWGQEVSEFRNKSVSPAPAKDEEDVMSYFASLASED
tara:strand:- start:2075 stop:2983 length:909 start_codon:yes stop_codon:yes gene_type:complete